jgi:hypothetical protein
MTTQIFRARFRHLTSAVVVVLAFALGGCSPSASSGVPSTFALPTVAPASAATATTTTTTTAKSKIPSGYAMLDDGVWFKWADKGTFDCESYHDSCWGVDIYSEYGCDDLYLEISILKNDVVVDNANDIISGIRAGGKAQSVMGQIGNSKGSAPLKARLVEANCY